MGNFVFGEFIKGATEYSQGLARSISGIRIIDAHTIEFYIKKPGKSFLNQLSHSAGVILPRESGYQFMDHDEIPNVGPYQVKLVSQGSSLLELNPGFGNKLVRGLNFLFENDENLCSMTKIGVLDIIRTTRALSSTCDLSDFRPHKIPTPTVAYLGFGPGVPLKLRKCIDRAIDRKLLMEDLGPQAINLTPHDRFFPNSEILPLRSNVKDDCEGLEPRNLKFIYQQSKHLPPVIARYLKKTLPNTLSTTLHSLSGESYLRAMKKGDFDIIYVGINGFFSDPGIFASLLTEKNALIRLPSAGKRMSSLIHQLSLETSPGLIEDIKSRIEAENQTNPLIAPLFRIDEIFWIKKHLRLDFSSWYFARSPGSKKCA